MVAISNLLNREAAAVTVLDPKDAERLVAKVASAQGKIMVDAGYAVYIGAASGLSNARMAEIFGKATSTITLYRRAGKYLVLGGEPTGDIWRVLTSKSKANDKRVGAVIDADDASVEKIEAVVNQHFTPDGKSRTPKTADANPSGKGAGDVPPLDEARVLVARLGVLSPSLAGEEWAEVETSLHDLIRTHNEAVMAASKGKAKAAASK